MNNGIDTIVLGLGGMGSAAAYHLARRGRRVLGLEQFWPAHDRGSSHGESRIIRLAYAESPVYVPLLRRAYELWHELETETGRELLRQTGGLMLGPPDSHTVNGALESARTWNLPHRMLEPSDLRREFPQFQTGDDIGFYEEAAGALFPEDCILAHQRRAAELGAELRFGVPVSTWRAVDGGVEVRVGDTSYTAESLVITAGAWAGKVLAELGLPLMPERNVLYWFPPKRYAALFQPDRCPIFIWDHPVHALYGLPNLRGAGVKVGFHHSGVRVDPDHLDRAVGDEEIAAVRAGLRECIPALDVEPSRTAVCMYTNTPDEHFAIGLHPAQPQVTIAAGFSGHGFKFACVMGEILAGLATDRATPHPIAPFALDRFAGVGSVN